MGLSASFAAIPLNAITVVVVIDADVVVVVLVVVIVGCFVIVMFVCLLSSS